MKMKLTSDELHACRETFFRGRKLIKTRWRCTFPLVGLEEEIINEGFTQSVLADFAICSYNEKETKTVFTVVCHMHSTE